MMALDLGLMGDDERGAAIGELMQVCARMLLHDPRVDNFMARLAHSGPVMFPELFDDHGEAAREDQARFFHAFGWAVASKMPLPAHGFRPPKLTLPGRNDRCLCGSGAKFKHCCGPAFEQLPPLESDGLGAVMIGELPRKDWTTLPQTPVTVQMVGAAALAMLDDDRAVDACKLLEPWAAMPAPWPDARADLLDLLLDVYLELDKPRKRKQLAEAMVKHGGATVQSVGWQRLAMIATDKGDTKGAAEAFRRAMRLTPDDPRVAVLEVTLLLGSGDAARASERARFHARRLARLPPTQELQGSIEALERLAQGDLPFPPGAGSGEPGEGLSIIGQMSQLIEQWPAPVLRLDLAQASAEDLDALRPDSASRKALTQWHRVFEWQAPRMTWQRADADALHLFEDDRWVPLLRRTPLLADQFEVLDALLSVLDLVPAALVAHAQALLLDRGLGLWALLRERFPRAACEWAHLDNRPALRLLARRIDIDPSPKAERSFEWLQAMVETLNPHDNHGFRERLAAVYLRRGMVDQALALCERYQDDFVGMQLLQARALLAAQRLPQAQAHLALALQANPHVLRLLLSTRKPREPDVTHFAVGSPEQARIVAAAQHDLWGKDKAVRAWLQSCTAAGPASGSLFDDPDG